MVLVIANTHRAYRDWLSHNKVTQADMKNFVLASSVDKIKGVKRRVPYVIATTPADPKIEQVLLAKEAINVTEDFKMFWEVRNESILYGNGRIIDPGV